MKKYTFTAKLVKDDKRSGFKKGREFDIAGFYYNGKNVVLKESVGGLLSMPADAVEIEVREAMGCFLLICEDASHLGGPMGSEYTEHVFSKAFPSILEAQKYAVKKQGKGRWPDYAEWTQQSNGNLTCDSGCYIWTIQKA